MPRIRSRRLRVATVVAFVVVQSAGTAPGLLGAAECWLPPVEAPVSDPFRPPACRWCPGNRGIEFATDAGDPVRAVRAGTVTFAGTVAGTRYVVVAHPGGVRATYGGLDERYVQRGDTVVARSLIATAGGRVHFGLRDGERYVDPTPRLGRAVYPVRLVPLDGSAARPVGPPRVVCEVVTPANTLPQRRVASVHPGGSIDGWLIVR